VRLENIEEMPSGFLRSWFSGHFNSPWSPVHNAPKALILAIMQEAGDLSLQLGHFRKVDEGRCVFEELALDFGREGAPSQNDGRSQTPGYLLFFSEDLIRFICE
jgi:hypothetical protein